MDGASLLLIGKEKEGARAQIVSAANVGVKPPLLTATVPAAAGIGAALILQRV